MLEIKNKVNCVGCYACYNACPTKAITLEEDKEGFKYPKIDKEKCINCGKCERVCPILNQKLKEENRIKPVIMAAWSKNEDIRIDSTSGGIFSELAKKVLQEQGVVVGALYTKSWKVEHAIITKESEIEKVRSSKYLQSDINDIYIKIEEYLKKNVKVLMCGTPCQIAGLYNYLNKEYENLITCDFICRGVNSPKIFEMYIKHLEQKYKSPIKQIKFKNKKHGWHNFSTKIDFENGKTYIGGRYTDSYMIGYLQHNAFIRPSCYECKFKGVPKKADITLGDFWGIEKIDQLLDNNKGTSIVMLNNEKAEEFFTSLKDNIFYKRIESKQVYEHNVCANSSVKMTKEREEVFKNIDNMSYEDLSKNFFKEPNMYKRLKIKIRESKIGRYIKGKGY